MAPTVDMTGRPGSRLPGWCGLLWRTSPLPAEVRTLVTTCKREDKVAFRCPKTPNAQATLGANHHVKKMRTQHLCHYTSFYSGCVAMGLDAWNAMCTTMAGVPHPRDPKCSCVQPKPLNVSAKPARSLQYARVKAMQISAASSRSLGTCSYTTWIFPTCFDPLLHLEPMEVFV